MKTKTAAALLLTVFVFTGCDLDMRKQPRYNPLQKSSFFKNGQTARPLVDGTVPRGFLREDEHLYTGKVSGKPAEEFPFPITEEVLLRGQQRYNIFCSVCHDQRGFGQGMVVQRGFKQPTSFHDERLVNSPPGYFFEVMTNGFGVMSDYSVEVAPHDRWAIAAYIKALQLSQNADLKDLTTEEQKKMSDLLQEQPVKHSESVHAS